MVNLAVEGTDFEGVREYLAGPTTIAFSYEDATAAAAQINKLLKSMPTLEFKASSMDGNVYDAAKTKLIAEIPSKDVLLSRLLGSLKSPMSSFARLVKAIADEKGGGETPAADAEAPVAEAPAAEAAPETPAEE